MPDIEIIPRKTRIPDSEHEKQYRLYLSGYSDYKIGAIMFKSASTICNWRKIHGLPSNSANVVTPENHAKRLELYNMGYLDREIAEAVNSNPLAIGQWRRNNGLPSNFRKRITRMTEEERCEHFTHIRRIKPDEDERRYYYWKKGYTDSKIAKLVHRKTATISYWRRKRGLPKNGSRPEFHGLTAKDKEHRFDLYYSGKSSKEMAALCGVTHGAMCNWIRKNVPTYKSLKERN